MPFSEELTMRFQRVCEKIQNSIKVVESHKFEINQAIHNLEIMDISQMDRELNNYKIVFEEYQKISRMERSQRRLEMKIKKVF